MSGVCSQGGLVRCRSSRWRAVFTISSASRILLLCLATCTCCACAWGKDEGHLAKFRLGSSDVAYEEFGSDLGRPTLILLHSVSGPGTALYRQQAQFFAAHGYTVLLLHYFDATKTHQPTAENYRAWVSAVDGLIQQKTAARRADQRIFLVGYSLGASLALAAGSQGAAVAAIAEWYGSLPDEFFYTFKGMPPLLVLHGARDRNIPVGSAEQLGRLCDLKGLICESHIYAEEEHGFAEQAREDADARTLAFFAKEAKD